tara:strand:- start:3 stop:1031 length:1029 start_codon:yes stop_codon:yes gene_type:complete
MLKNNINYMIRATPLINNYFVNSDYIVKIKLPILFVIIFISMSCVENEIFIQILPDGKAFVRIVSIGDSTDILDKDFEHPSFNSKNSSYELIKTDSIWKSITNLVIKDSTFNFNPKNGLGFGFNFQQKIKSSSKINSFKMNFIGRDIQNEYPILYNSIMNNKLDSLIWLPEALTVIIDKALTDLEKDSIYKKEEISRPRLVNHFKNSFSRISTFEELENIQENRAVFIHNTLKPFKVSQKFSAFLSKKMKVHEDRLKSSLGLKDDNFIIKLLLPGEAISGNAMSMNEDTLIWKFGLDSLLNNNYDLYASSVTTSKKKVQKTSILIVFFLLLFSIILISKQKQ